MKKNVEFIDENNFIENKADIGGSIFSENIIEVNKEKRNYTDYHNHMTTHLFANKFNGNIGTNNSKNTFSYFSNLVLDMNNSINDREYQYNNQKDESEIEIVSSGNKLNLTFRLID